MKLILSEVFDKAAISLKSFSWIPLVPRLQIRYKCKLLSAVAKTDPGTPP